MGLNTSELMLLTDNRRFYAGGREGVKIVALGPQRAYSFNTKGINVQTFHNSRLHT